MKASQIVKFLLAFLFSLILFSTSLFISKPATAAKDLNPELVYYCPKGTYLEFEQQMQFINCVTAIPTGEKAIISEPSPEELKEKELTRLNTNTEVTVKTGKQFLFVRENPYEGVIFIFIVDEDEE
jgi:hypothetical protein